jgi:hypothetical protein
LPILTSAVVALLAAVLLPGGPATAPLRAVNSSLTLSPSPSPTVSPSPSLSLSPSPISGGCFGCVNPLDAICWEGPPRCTVVVVRFAPRTQTVTVYYRTVAMTAKPQLDYVEVRSAMMTIQPGQSSAEIVVQLLPNPDLDQDRKFGVELFAVSGAGLVRPMATVTIKPAQKLGVGGSGRLG